MQLTLIMCSPCAGHLELRPDKNAGGYPYRSLPDAEVGLVSTRAQLEGCKKRRACCGAVSCNPSHRHPNLLALDVAQNALQNYWNKNRQDIRRCAAHLLSGKKDVDWVVSGPLLLLAPRLLLGWVNQLLSSTVSCTDCGPLPRMFRRVQGMAWEGVLCGWYGSKGDNWAYGFTSNLEGDFTWSGVQVLAGGARGRGCLC